ncbi:hypothetical protein FQN54_001104 [Arachnomyces sp. PD_36]|nr:hypothetical protein FQN54_001104 [Arachnomyces sp. PD_36]
MPGVMAPERRESSSLRLDLSYQSSQDSPPGIAALFQIRFDVKAGYTVVWKRTIPGVELSDAVEYKALPSGLHNVQEDLIYFVQDQYAGICAFVNHPAPETERGALMLAVGVLVPLSYGRLGKSWKHAVGLKSLVQKLIADEDDPQPLSEYWEDYQISDDDAASLPESPLDSPSSLRSKPVEPRIPRESFRRSRALSDATALMTSKHGLTPFHPAFSLPEFVGSFGPLIFPLYKAALLRKRILITGDAPVQLPCNFVYDLSLLASLPQSLVPLLPAGPLPPLRPRPLFNVGVHDIPSLSLPHSPTLPEDTLHPSWIAFTTDHVLKTKPDLYDILVSLSPPYSKQATKKSHPEIIISSKQSGQSNSQPATLKATQRDARRYIMLREGLQQLSRGDTQEDELDDTDSDASSTFSSNSIIEPLSWPLLAYTSFIWWASAGEKRAGPSEDEDDQDEQDARLLLADVDNTPHLTYATGTARRRSLLLDDHDKQPLEIALVAYFRRLTTKIFTTLSDAVARQDDVISNAYHDYPNETYPSQQQGGYTDNVDEDDDTVIHHPNEDPNQPLLQSDSRQEEFLHDDDPIMVTTSDMTLMGLDVWSAADRTFVEELVAVWWGRKAEVQGARVRCCGVPII